MASQRRPIRAALLLALAAVAGIGAAGCSSAPKMRLVGETGRLFADPSPAPGIPSFAWLNADVARGGQPDDEGLAWLKAQGFRTIVSFRQHHSERDRIEHAGLRSIELPVQADALGSSPPTEEQVRLFFATVTDSAQQPVFFHCRRGADRTGLFGALYRMEIEGWTNDEAIEEMQAFGYNDFYRDLIGYARDYDPTSATAP